MIVGLNESVQFLIQILTKFKQYLELKEIELEILNTYNHPYLEKFATTTSNLIVLKSESFEGLTPRNLRGRNFCKTSNEFRLRFSLYFLSFTLLKAYRDSYESMCKVYEHFLEFLYENKFRFEFVKELESGYCLLLTYYLCSISNLNNDGLLGVSNMKSNLCFSLNQIFLANIQVVKQEM
ncbi:DUF764 family protein [Borreliella tanukii]|uniref:DUF764 family protein n=1 Tax=Borreliella tanukii TaxID=56146 RepID=UPI0026484D1B|nr:DUF764 family protein [Borreliella tanukii]WKC79407.1 DUF764 family protein [Borreliella tanukii]WKC80326.1 DUF764 family protein [Borreliella tanukii]WKC81239.1 DUF764 family protein [Borreliella tanukii]WKC82154.1 DUF764 family protein [Borreliella tanukii]